MLNDKRIARGGLPQRRRTPAPARKTAPDQDEPLIKTLFISSLIGVATGVGLGLIILLIVCFIALSSSDPLSIISPLSLLALFPSNFIAGFISTKRTGQSPLACGLVASALWGAASLILSALPFFSSSNLALWQSLILHLASTVFSILGAFAGAYKPQRDMRRHKRFAGR